jgi:hypothetical protein
MREARRPRRKKRKEEKEEKVGIKKGNKENERSRILYNLGWKERRVRE